jgi:protein SCO1/2
VKSTTLVFCISLLLSAAPAWADSSAPAAAPLPGESVLQLPGLFTDQSSKTFHLSARRGAAQLIGMFYGSCQSVCPLLIDSSVAITRALEPGQRSRLRVLLVSLDPARDTPAVLARVAREHRLDLVHWTLARTDEKTVRQLAAVLNVRYRQLETGEFNHTSALILLDRDGREIARNENLSLTPDPQFIAAIRGAMQEP